MALPDKRIISFVTGEVSHSRLHSQKIINTQHHGADKWTSEKTVVLSAQRIVVSLPLWSLQTGFGVHQSRHSSTDQNS